MKIGIAITERDRYDIFKKSYDEIKMYLPKGAVLVVVDDASSIPVKEATYRFEKNVGIAVAKNKCIELLYNAGCDHLFLFDSDAYPKCDDWWKPYVESPENHLMYIFKDFAGSRPVGDTKIVYQDSKHIAYDHPRGCMLYFSRKAIEQVGGMDEVFKKWGYEHGNLSDRIFTAGLTSFRYMDIVGSSDLIYSVDEHTLNKYSTTKLLERKKLIAINKPEYEKRIDDYYYFPFAKENIFVTCYFTNVADTQENKGKWKTNAHDLEDLIASIQNTGNKLVVLHDCFDEIHADNVEFIKVETSVNPYIQRWISYYQFLQSRCYANVFFVDGTDVEILRTPQWEIIGDDLYCGDENEILNCPWIIGKHNTPKLNKFYKDFKGSQLLNAGVVGGSYCTMVEFTRAMVDFYSKEINIGMTDMAMFNYVCRNKFNGRLKYGRQVTTLFKAEERNNTTSWIKHK